MSGLNGHRPVLRLKSSDQISVEEHARFQPFLVIMREVNSGLELEPATLQFYVRAPKPELAAMFAYKLWLKWRRTDRGIGEFDSKYPEVVDDGIVTVLDENDFRSVWKSMSGVKFPKFTGPSRNPIGFLFEKDGTTNIINN